MKPEKNKNILRVATNRRARHDYEILDTFEAGIVLLGPEVKSMREGGVNMSDAYAELRGLECFLVNLHISPYKFSREKAQDPKRDRKLLLHKQEINRLDGKIRQKGFTLIPLSIYFKKGLAKVELALARGKKYRDRREDIRKRDEQRIMERELRNEAKV